MSGPSQLFLFRGEESGFDGSISGWQVFTVPTFRVILTPAVSKPRPEQPVILTSRHAARWFVEYCAFHGGPVAVSGISTAAPLRKIGKAPLVARELGGEGALRALVRQIGTEEEIFFPCGPKTAGTVERAAEELGVKLCRCQVYALRPLSLSFPEGADAVAFLSGQAVELVHDGLGEEGWNRLRKLPALSTATAETALLRAGWIGETRRLEKRALEFPDLGITSLLERWVPVQSEASESSPAN